MKKLSDYKGEEAIDLLADLLEPVADILADVRIKRLIRSGKPVAVLAKEILKTHKKEACEIIERIDSTPLNGANAFTRFIGVINDFIENSEELSSFFGVAESAMTDEESSGSVTESFEERAD